MNLHSLGDNKLLLIYLDLSFGLKKSIIALRQQYLHAPKANEV